MQLGMNLDEVHKQKVMQLNELDEIKKDALQSTTLIQDQRDKWHDKVIKKNSFQPGD